MHVHQKMPIIVVCAVTESLKAFKIKIKQAILLNIITLVSAKLIYEQTGACGGNLASM